MIYTIHRVESPHRHSLRALDALAALESHRAQFEVTRLLVKFSSNAKIGMQILKECYVRDGTHDPAREAIMRVL